MPAAKADASPANETATRSHLPTSRAAEKRIELTSKRDSEPSCIEIEVGDLSLLKSLGEQEARHPPRMTGKRLSAILSLLALFSAHAPLRAYTVQYRDSSGVIARRWLVQPIIIAFSTSLQSPPANIKAGTDVVGAARRALRRWSNVSNVQFFETSSSVQTISPPGAGDRINLITVSPDNSSAFDSQD